MPPSPTDLRFGIAALSVAACAALSGCVVSPADSNPQHASLPLPPVTTTVRESTTITATSTVTPEPVTETMYIIPDAFTETVTVTPEPVTETVYPEPVTETVYPEPVTETVYPEPVTETVYPEPVTETVLVTETVEVYIQQQAQAAPAPEASYYQNCAAARAAGVTPIYRGEPGYRSGLDRDGDGIACE